MTERRRERVFAAGIVALLLAGLAFDLQTSDVAPAESAPARGGFEAHSVFCPGAVAGKRSDIDLVVTAAGGGEVPVGIEPQEEDTVDVPGPGALIYDVGNVAPAAVVGYGAPASVAVLTTTERPGEGAGAARCAERASTEWFFAAGSASIHADERILLYNPFSDEAVVRLSVYTPAGERTRASLADVAVPAGDFTVVKLNEKVLPEDTLAVRVAAERGRVVAWRQLFVDEREGRRGMQFSLGAPETATAWHFPEGVVGGGARARISVLNPGEEEAVIAVSLAVGSEEALSPPRLMEVAVAPRSQRVINVERHVDAGDEPLAVAATVRSVNDVGVVAEREVFYAGDARGMAAEVGATTEHRRWMLPPAARAPVGDAVAVLNPSTAPARLSLRLVAPKGAGIATPDLGEIEIAPGGRVRIPLARFTQGRPVIVVVEASVPVVAERFATSGAGRDAAGVMGIPLR